MKNKLIKVMDWIASYKGNILMIVMSLLCVILTTMKFGMLESLVWIVVILDNLELYKIKKEKSLTNNH